MSKDFSYRVASPVAVSFSDAAKSSHPPTPPKEAMAAFQAAKKALQANLVKLEELNYDPLYMSYFDKLFQMKEEVSLLAAMATQTGNDPRREVEEAYHLVRAYDLAVLRCTANMLSDSGKTINQLLSQRAIGPLPGDIENIQGHIHHLAEYILLNIKKPSPR